MILRPPSLVRRMPMTKLLEIRRQASASTRATLKGRTTQSAFFRATAPICSARKAVEKSRPNLDSAGGVIYYDLQLRFHRS